MSQEITEALLRERAAFAAKGDAERAAQVDEQLTYYGFEGVEDLEVVEPREPDADELEDPLVETLRLENDSLRAELTKATTERDDLAAKAAERDELAKKVESLEAAAAERAAARGPAPVDAKPAPKSTRSK